MLASKPGLGDLAQSMRLVEGVHEGQGKDDHQHHYDQGVDLKKALHTWFKKNWTAKKNTKLPELVSAGKSTSFTICHPMACSYIW